MDHSFQNVKNCPHLNFQSTEFIDLADAEVLIDGFSIPLHSHVLANSSKVFAQFFSSFPEDITGNRGAPTSVTELFAGESLKGVLLLLLMFYHRETIEAVISDQTWGKDNKHAPEPVAYPQEEMPPALLQSAARLAHKLDCHYIIEQLENNTKFITSDPLGWLVESRALKLHKVTMAALRHLVESLSYCPQADYEQVAGAETMILRINALKLMRDKRWLELDQIAFLLIMEARTLFDLNGKWTRKNNRLTFKGATLENYAALENYAEPGDLIQSETLGGSDIRCPFSSLPGRVDRPVPFHPPIRPSFPFAREVRQQELEALQELQEEQAAEDFNGEWDDDEQEVIDD
jgi:hypothetical protein